MLPCLYCSYTWDTNCNNINSKKMLSNQKDCVFIKKHAVDLNMNIKP